MPSPIARLATAPCKRPLYIVFDFETNGLGKTSGIRVVQVGAQALDSDFVTVSAFNEFVNPLAAIDPKAVAVHGIDPAFANQCAAWDDVGTRFNKWMDDVRHDDAQPLVMLAHNGKRFDARILVYENYRHNIKMLPNIHHADTIEVFKQIYPGQPNYKLGDVYANIVGKPLADAHTADADVEGLCTLLRLRNGVGDAIAAAQESYSAIVKRCMK